VALAAVAVIAAVAPAVAAAAQRYASPGGGGTACTQAAPCGFETAVEGAADGDEVIVLPGVHTPSDEVLLDSAAVVHGDEAQAHPTIASTEPTAIRVTHGGAQVGWLNVAHTGSGDAVVLDGGTGQRLSVSSTGGGLACHVDDASLTESVCWAAGPGDGAGMVATTATEHATLVNVTAVASSGGSAGLRVESAPGGWAELRALNVIAKGGVDTQIVSTPTSITVANISFSNFETQSIDGPNSFATGPGVAGNQTVQPVFVDAAGGDFHQDASSPTVDQGALEEGVSATDFEGEPRGQGFGIDIGADELPVAPLPPDTNPPDTRILKRPKRRTNSRKARFKFGTTEPAGAVYMCSLDGKAFKSCKSPMKLRVKRGRRHTFAVFSIDEAGNADPTPDSCSWKVRRKQDDD
jgi:hypothetical protein